MSVGIEQQPVVPLIRPRSTSSRWLAAGLVLGLFLIFWLLHNPYWVRHGDSEVFLSIARNLAAGEGYRFNGQPVAFVPPGWPLVLAGVMKFTASLSILKLIPMAATIGFLLISYFLLLRVATPLIAAMCIITTALLEPVFSLGFLFFSDSLFALIVTAGVWTALKISDGKSSWAWIALLVGLCVLSVMVRWAGLPFFAYVGAAVLHGELKPRWNRRWIAFGLSALATVLTFLMLRAMLRVDESQLDPRYDSFVAGHYSMLSQTADDDTYATRIVRFGEWIGGLLWRPMQTYRFSRALDNAAGWGVSLLLLVVVVRACARRQWVWLGGGLYLVALGINWPDPMSRYIIPLAPFILYGTYEAITTLTTRLARTDNLRLLTLNAFFAGILAINGVLYLMHVAVLRSGNFYEAWQGGAHKQLIDAAAYLRRVPPGDYEIAISGKTVNFGRTFPETDGFRRALNFLTARNIVTMPFDLCREPDPAVVRWLTEHNVRYYLYQPPIQLVEHFRPWTDDGQRLPDGSWRLYEITNGNPRRIIPPPTGDWPREVQGL